MKILCVYATRQIDSNLFMSSTVFNGLQQCGYEVDMVFLGYTQVCETFQQRYAKYFNHVAYYNIKESLLKRLANCSGRTKLLYSFYLHFFKDCFFRPYNLSAIRGDIKEHYDVILSFIPSALSGYLAWDIKRDKRFKDTPLVQFWTDPLSLGRCNDIIEIPKTRFMHVKIEHQLLSYADKAVFCYPLLCEMEQKLHPEFRDKMTWSDVGYTEHHAHESTTKLGEIGGGAKIGLFGSYQSSVRNIRPLLEATKSFAKETFIIRGDSDINISHDEFPNVDAKKERISVDEVEALEQNCDILIILGNKGGIQIPGKTYYYANYNKPLICICDSIHAGELKKYLQPLNRYIICNNDSNSIIGAIQKAIKEISDFHLVIPKRLEPANIARKIVETN